MRRSKRQATSSTPPVPAGFHHQPFRQLTGRAAAPPPPPPADIPPPIAPRPEAAPADSDDELFRRAMVDVRQLSAAERARVLPPAPAPAPRGVTDPEAEALAELSDLVSGGGSFDIANSVECVEGSVVGLDRRLLRRLRGGEFAYQSHLDLHGMSAVEARGAVDRFLTEAQQRGQRCVLIIHGRGHNSKDQVPVLKQRLAAWLARGTWNRLVLAFTSARPCDGGTGALYVLLRRQRQGKHPIQVTHGAKW